ncbi:MAG: hypothetical protein LQ349_003204 [Xanthoria aureola]|nr:MAG: hypothetical protein LQ349_003204 [Xanthoria aureola]
MSSSPDETIHRILFLSPTVHIYSVPPLTSTKGYTTTNWSPLLAPTSTPTAPTTAITTRLRVLETSSPSPPPPSSTLSSASSSSTENNQIQTTILLEDPTSGALFAAAPYTSPQTVEPVLDSARFFALTVQGEAEGGKKKAVLGIGFEERSEAIDFGICLQGVRKVLGFDQGAAAAGVGGKGGRRGGGGGGGEAAAKEATRKKDWGLKEGEMIKVEIGGMGVKRKERLEVVGGAEDGEKALFSIQPPPRNQSTGGMPLVPPPPSAEEVKAESRRSRGPVMIPEKGSAADLGFHDGEFGEFQ